MNSLSRKCTRLSVTNNVNFFVNFRTEWPLLGKLCLEIYLSQKWNQHQDLDALILRVLCRMSFYDLMHLALNYADEILFIWLLQHLWISHRSIEITTYIYSCRVVFIITNQSTCSSVSIVFTLCALSVLVLLYSFRPQTQNLPHPSQLSEPVLQ